MSQRVVVVGGGFGGMLAVRGLRRADVHVTLVDRQNFYLFQPLVYQVATGSLSSVEVAVPLRQALRRRPNVHVVLGEVTGFDLDAKTVQVDDLPNGQTRSPAARATRTSATTSGRRTHRSSSRSRGRSISATGFCSPSRRPRPRRTPTPARPG